MVLLNGKRRKTKTAESHTRIKLSKVEDIFNDMRAGVSASSLYSLHLQSWQIQNKLCDDFRLPCTSRETWLEDSLNKNTQHVLGCSGRFCSMGLISHLAIVEIPLACGLLYSAWGGTHFTPRHIICRSILNTVQCHYYFPGQSYCLGGWGECN